MSTKEVYGHSPEELFEQHSHLAEVTLYRFLGQPHNVARSKSMEFDDLLQYAHMGLWRACTTYNKEQSRFESHAINNIRWAVQNGLNRESELFKYNVNNMPDESDKYNLIGYDNPVTNSGDNDALSVSETVPTTQHDVEESTVNSLLIEELLDLLTSRERRIIELKSKDMIDDDIAEIFGTTKQSINRTVHNVRRKLQHKKEEVFSYL